MPPKEGNCWGIAEAERRIHGYAARENDEFELAYTRHATERMAERGIIVSDLGRPAVKVVTVMWRDVE